MVNLACALGSAILLVLLFPPFGLNWLAPFALVPLVLLCAREPSAKKRWLFGWAAGFVFWCGLCPWIQFVLEVHGGMGRWGGWGTFVLFGFYKGLPTALFTLLAGFLISKWYALPAIAALWTGIDRLHAFTGFAWLPLGNAGINMPLPMRLAPVTGVYGLTFLFAMLGCAVAFVVLKRPRLQLAWLLVFVILLFLPRASPPSPPMEKALLVQPNIDTETNWTKAFLDDTEHRLAQLSRGGGFRLIIWPEAPAPFYPERADFREYVANIARTSNAYFLFSGVGFTADHAPLNSAFLFDPRGNAAGRYDKINLVPFGEFIPPFFHFVNRITQEAGDFASGKKIELFAIDNHSAGAFICYESVLPDFVRQFTLGGAEVLLNLSNDGYFGNSAAHQQHLLIARMRAAENQRWLLRATNDGITAVIDPRGRITEQLAPFAQTARIVDFSFEKGVTPYVRYGDWFAWSCLVTGGALSLYSLVTKSAGSPKRRHP